MPNAWCLRAVTLDMAEPAVRKCEAEEGGASSCSRHCRHCRHCRHAMPAAGAMRIGMEVASTFKEGSTMFLWSNVDALFESFRKGSATKNRVTSLDQLAGHDALRDEDQETLERLIGEQGDLLETLAEADKDTTRLECTAGGESKFWSVAVAGNLTRVRWGAIGDEGNISEKQHGDDDTAAKFAEKKIKEKLKKGYEQIDGTKKRKQDTGKDAGATPDAGAAKPKKAKTAKKAPAKAAKVAKVAKTEGKAAPAAAKDGEVIHSWCGGWHMLGGGWEGACLRVWVAATGAWRHAARRGRAACTRVSYARACGCWRA